MARILALEPDNQTVIYNLGILAYESGDLQASPPLPGEVWKAHPTKEKSSQMLFDIYRKQNKDDLAFKKAQALVALHPREYQTYLLYPGVPQQ